MANQELRIARRKRRTNTAERIYPMTLEGKERSEQKLEELETIKRKEVVGRIKITCSFGDLSENSGYESAKNEQASVEGRITTLGDMIRFVEIINNNGADQDEVSIGEIVTFRELSDGEEGEYTIVGSAEADPFSGKVSSDSLIVQALIDKQLGSQVIIVAPGGDVIVKATRVEAN